MFKVSPRTSAKTGVAPQCTITFAVDGQVIDVVITSSPGPTPSATSDRCRAAVQDETASTWSASRYSRMRASSSAVRGPVVSQPERSVSATASISSSVIAGGWNERKSVRLVEESSGIRGEKAYAVGGGVRARQGLSARVADCEHRAGSIGAALQRCEHVAGLPVDPDPPDARQVLRLLDRLEHAGGCDEEARRRSADQLAVPGRHARVTEGCIDREP